VKKHKNASTVDRTRVLQIFSLTLSQLSYASRFACFGRFRSYDPWVMSPIRFLCATKLLARVGRVVNTVRIIRTRDPPIDRYHLSQLSYGTTVDVPICHDLCLLTTFKCSSVLHTNMSAFLTFHMSVKCILTAPN
jgi:hypothetical protein